MQVLRPGMRMVASLVTVIALHAWLLQPEYSMEKIINTVFAYRNATDCDTAVDKKGRFYPIGSRINLKTAWNG
jgi:hypothetical protein